MSSSELRHRKALPTTPPTSSSTGHHKKDKVSILEVETDDDAVYQTPGFQSEHFIDALYKPHTITVLIVTLSILAYFAFLQQQFPTEQNIKRGLVAVIAIFLVYCATQLRDGIFLRPHPVLWRIVLGVGLLYLCTLIFILFQSRDDVRKWLAFFYPYLGKPLPERSYADDCRLYTPEDPVSHFRNLRDTLFDEFIIAHVLGYVAKGILFRDYKLCWVISISFELSEITFQHWLENFKECWWDHIIVDVLVCNALGIYIGLKIADYFGMKKYSEWVGVSDIPSTTGRISRIIGQFTPFNWANYNWGIFQNYKRFLYFVGIVVAMNLVELNAFFLKYELWVPPRNPLNTYRLILWLFIGMPAIREYYEYISNPRVKRLGASTWVAGAILGAETTIIVKFSEGLFHEPFPNHIWVPWTITITVLIFWFVLYFFVMSEETRNKGLGKLISRILLSLMIAPQVFMFLAGMPDVQLFRAEFDTFVDHQLVKFGWKV